MWVFCYNGINNSKRGSKMDTQMILLALLGMILIVLLMLLILILTPVDITIIGTGKPFAFYLWDKS